MITQEKFADYGGDICPVCEGTDIEHNHEYGEDYGVCLNEDCNVSFDFITEIVGYDTVYDENGDVVKD